MDYIVEHTLGKLLQGKTPEEAARIKIVDPACGAGVFLLGAYQYLLDWHENHGGKLTLAKRRKILTDNIFGVDIDPLAVEITKYCLSMMCSEGKDFSIGLEKNIRCGNSLIGSDFYNDTNMTLLSDAEMRNINAFDWAKEFPHVFHKQGGFDIIIGNPPWGQKTVKFDVMSRLYFSKCYPTSSIGIVDLFRFFIEKAFVLLRDGGLWGQVLPDIILMKNYESTRRLILDTVTLQHIAHWGRPFSLANIEVCTLIGTKETLAKNKKNNIQTVIHLKDSKVVENRVNQNIFRQLPGSKFNILLTKKSHAILQKFETLPVFSDYFATHEGIHTGNARDLLFINNKIDKHCKKLI